ncbi:type 1 fimbrial protein [Brenneria goodwinii]|uniref:fimbrial protein n=1 Tax=Brenneria goodwinii TaxID=1109412 RepID=UPI000EF19097|nr:fimbrial protein [Brenneria goodwinii]MCG8156920.1 type 1 fimbrial protein [Brenneria goodwinii]MCG8161505.1 type 1 fimbrial protein [Brenneria goodwinii]MCG8165606.1 type 1 fimbrial protein [Brenneria goodwinii]MCG8170094.1 type 1 fimbrial protein [Brenneria goodwinii]MCG8174304.1 type 1 fimbrial protein [Brenneria goodwinii]
MKLSKIALATIVAASCVMSTGVHAYDNHNGVVTFKGNIVNTPCSVSQDDLKQSVEFGDISKVVLENGGTSDVKSFDITLKDCAIETSNTANVTFSGGTVTGSNNKMLALNGSATGAGIVVKYSGEAIAFDGATAAVSDYNLANGDNTFSFSSYVEKAVNATGVTTGTFESTANFVISYQ